MTTKDDARNAWNQATAAFEHFQYATAAGFYRIASAIYRKCGDYVTAETMDELAEKCDELSDEEMA